MKKTSWRMTEGGKMRMSSPGILGYNAKTKMPIGPMSVEGTTPKGPMSKEEKKRSSKKKV